MCNHSNKLIMSLILVTIRAANAGDIVPTSVMTYESEPAVKSLGKAAMCPISGRYAVIINQDIGAGQTQPAIDIYDGNTDERFNRLWPDIAYVQGDFGTDIAIQGIWVAVSGRRADADAPQVDLYNILTGFETSITMLDDDHFGVTLAMNNNFLFVASDNVYPKPDRVHQYRLSDLSHVRTLTGESPDLDDEFGRALDVNDDRLVIGAATNAPAADGKWRASISMFKTESGNRLWSVGTFGTGNSGFGQAVVMGSGFPETATFGRVWTFRISDGFIFMHIPYWHPGQLASQDYMLARWSVHTVMRAHVLRSDGTSGYELKRRDFNGFDRLTTCAGIEGDGYADSMMNHPDGSFYVVHTNTTYGDGQRGSILKFTSSRCRADVYPTDENGLVGNGQVNVDDVIATVLQIGQVADQFDVAPCNSDGSIGNGEVNIDDLIWVINSMGTCN
ncbi:MAG: hypothetical protein AAF432_04480 [Planctomycetota bacterium]